MKTSISNFFLMKPLNSNGLHRVNVPGYLNNLCMKMAPNAQQNKHSPLAGQHQC